MKKHYLIIGLFFALALAGCATVPMANVEWAETFYLTERDTYGL